MSQRRIKLPPQGNHSKKMEQLLESKPHLLRPGIQLFSIAHDSWCEFLAGTGPCNCDPDVTPIPRGEDN